MNSNPILAILVFYPFLGALLVWAVGRKDGTFRDLLADSVAAAEFLILVLLWISSGPRVSAGITEGFRIPGICGFGLSFTLDGFRLIYGTVAAFMWLMTTILSREYLSHEANRNRFYLFLLMTLGATMGVFLSEDLFTTFIFFEIMSLTSYVWVAQEENKRALRAADTYLAVAVLGGMVMLMGLFLLYHELGTLSMAELLASASALKDKTVLYGAGACLLFGFGAKAGAFPLHIWLPKAHPVAPAPASALLSGILTKTGIFGILIISSEIFLHDKTWGNLILGLGVVTMFTGALLALFSVDLKRTLACSSMSQIGFILVGIGMQGILGGENALAVHGTLLHMVNHSMIKLVLFMAAGVIYMNTHSLDLNRIRGFGRNKPLLKAIFLVGALAIGGIPLFGGYISKTLLHESIVEAGGGLMKLVEGIFLVSGGMTVAYMTKLYMAVFVEENEDSTLQKQYDRKKKYMNRETSFALAGSASVLLIWGLFPHSLMDAAAGLGQGLMHLDEFGEQVSYFSLSSLSGAGISILIGLGVYLTVVRKWMIRKDSDGSCSYVDRWPAWLDLEEAVYRPLLLRILPLLFGFFCRILDSFADLTVVFLRRTVYCDSPLPYELPEGNAFTLHLGKILNLFRNVANLTWLRKNPSETDFVHLLAIKADEIGENNRIIGRSLSFGLMLVCIGLCLTLIYLILWH